MGRIRFTQEEFETKAKLVHPNYDFSKSIYKNADTKVIVICPLHGEFEITPYHLIKRNQGCSKCSGKGKLTQKDFLERVKKISPEYDYSQSVYINSKIKVKVICKKHGIFEVVPESLFQGHKCPKCARKITKRFSQEEFISRAKQIHPEFDYSKSIYEDYRKKLDIFCSIHGYFKISPHDLLQGQGCPKCAGKNFSQQEQLERFISFRPEYSYEKTIYVKTHEKVIITCNKHGDFKITPHNFFQGQGCPKCGIEKRAESQRLGKEEFIKRALLMHPEYDYSGVIYHNNLTKVKIICKKHGEFLITPGSFLRGSICAKCSNEKSAERQKMSKEEFIQRAMKIFPNYDYSKVVYINNHTKIDVICPKHGNIKLIPANMLTGMGCRRCGVEKTANLQRMTLGTFINRAKLIHPEYDYSQVVYINSDTKVKVRCSKHGDFMIIPYSLLSGSGCPVCNISIGESKINKWLESHNFKPNTQDKEKLFIRQKTFPDLMDQKLLSYDFYIPSQNLLIEFNGEQHYHPVEIFQRKGQKTFEKQKYHDYLKEKYASDNNFRLLIIPYTSINRIDNILSEYIVTSCNT